jgi:hypothetical protein
MIYGIFAHFHIHIEKLTRLIFNFYFMFEAIILDI